MNFRGVGPFFQSWVWKAAVGDRKGSLETAWAGCSPKCEPTGTGLSVRHCAFVLQEAFLSPGQACVLFISLQVGLPPCFLTVSCPNTGVRLWCQKTPFAAKAKNWVWVDAAGDLLKKCKFSSKTSARNEQGPPGGRACFLITGKTTHRKFVIHYRTNISKRDWQALPSLART